MSPEDAPVNSNINRDGTKLDVIDGEAAVRDRRGNRRETQRLESLVQLQEDRRAPLLIRPPNEVEAKTFPGAREFCEKSEIQP